MFTKSSNCAILTRVENQWQISCLHCWILLIPVFRYMSDSTKLQTASSSFNTSWSPHYTDLTCQKYKKKPLTASLPSYLVRKLEKPGTPRLVQVGHIKTYTQVWTNRQTVGLNRMRYQRLSLKPQLNILSEEGTVIWWFSQNSGIDGITKLWPSLK